MVGFAGCNFRKKINSSPLQLRQDSVVTLKINCYFKTEDIIVFTSGKYVKNIDQSKRMIIPDEHLESILSDYINFENSSFEDEFKYNKISNDPTVRATLVEVSKQNSNHDQLIKKNFEFEISAWIYLSIMLFLIGFMIYLMIKLKKIEEKMQNLQMNQSLLRQ